MLQPAHTIRRLSLGNEQFRAASRCIAILLTVVIFGTLGFWYIEHDNDWGLWKSLFFTLITITTVGYGDQGLSPTGEKFAAVLLLFGIGSATYSITSLVQIAVSYQSTRKQKMQNKIARLQDHLIICGFGRIGRTVAQELRKTEMPFVVVDCEPTIVEERSITILWRCRAIQLTTKCYVRQGSSAQKESFASRVRTLKTSLSRFVLVNSIPVHLSPAVRARIAARRMERAGATLVVSPYTTAGHNIADAILRPKLAQFLHSNRSGNIELGEFQISEDSKIVGETIQSVGREFPTVVFVAVKRHDADSPTRPGGNQAFCAGDAVTVAGPRRDLERLYLQAEHVRELAHC